MLAPGFTADRHAFCPAGRHASADDFRLAHIAACLAEIIGERGRSEAEAAQTSLLPGQMLVSKSGKLWRWDGLIRKGEASSEAEHLRQRQRLGQLGAGRKRQPAFADKQKALDEAGTAHAENLSQYRALQEQSRR